MAIETYLKESIPSSAQPEFFRLSKEDDQRKLEDYFEQRQIKHVIDRYKEQLAELFAIKNPQLVYQPEFSERQKKDLDQHTEQAPLWKQGVWVFFPWRSTLVHLLEEDDFQSVRFARNRNLITAEEQTRFYNATIGVAGLSVGNSVALNLVLEGGAKNLKLADFDTLDLSNLNRIRGGVEGLGLKKVEITARQVYELNPYANIQLYTEGIGETTIEQFFDDAPKLDLIIDEIDSLSAKLMIRQEAKKRKIPVLMAADNGENGLVDIERYDEDDALPYFHGRLGDITLERLKGLNKFETGQLIAQFVGFENIPLRMFESLGEMGKSIVSWPQLGGPALLNGAAVAYCARRILNKQPLEPDRALISLDKLFIPEDEYKKEEERQREFLQKMRSQSLS